MGIDFKPTGDNTNTNEVTLSKQSQNQGLINFDMKEERQRLDQQLINSEEVDSIVSTINVYEPNTLVTFGSQAAEGISKCSDQVLSSMNMQQINDSGTLLNSLGVIMDQFDIQELENATNQGFFNKLFNNAQKQLDKILAKYHTMGDEVDKIYVQLKGYENEIGESNKKIDVLFDANVQYYQELVKYILAGEQGIAEIDQHLVNMRTEYEQTQDNMLFMDINNLEQAKTLLEQRVMDLKMAEHVAIQSLPMLKTMEYSNLNLIRKINSAFIVTLPVFKQGITQAILLKRQRIQADAMQALDKRTNEMLLKNAQNTADQAKLTAQLASGSSIKIETLEKTWETIMSGITETKQIEEQAKQKRQEDSVRLNQLKEEYKNQLVIDSTSKAHLN